VYRRHVDGAWPGGGVVDGRLQYDAFGDRWSRLTMVLYLNEGFDGGATTFYMPANADADDCGARRGELDAHSVTPQMGGALFFTHGETAGTQLPFAPVHEGTEVRRGVKYIIRTDVLYTLPPIADDDEMAQQQRRKHQRHLGVNAQLFAAPAAKGEAKGDSASSADAVEQLE
jgi:hypothetical protein